jgi:hypothetical protein
MLLSPETIILGGDLVRGKINQNAVRPIGQIA